MMAGATPSALAAAVRLPRCATDTKDSICLSLSMHLLRQRQDARLHHSDDVGLGVTKLKQHLAPVLA